MRHSGVSQFELEVELKAFSVAPMIGAPRRNGFAKAPQSAANLSYR